MTFVIPYPDTSLQQQAIQHRLALFKKVQEVLNDYTPQKYHQLFLDIDAEKEAARLRIEQLGKDKEWLEELDPKNTNQVRCSQCRRYQCGGHGDWR